MAEKPIKDVLDEDDDLPGAEGGDGLDVQFEADALTDPAPGESEAGEGEDGGADADDEPLSAGGEDGDDDDQQVASADAGAIDGLDGEDEDPELASYSKKVRDRIRRERRTSRQAREEADAERAQRITAQRELWKANKGMVEVLSTTVASAIITKTAELKAAKEAGDTSKEVDLQQELNELQTRRRDLDTAKQNFVAEPDFEGKARPNEAASGWKERNRWYSHPKFKAEKLLVEDLDRKLTASGTAGNNRSPEYFKELDRQIAAEMPDLRTKIKQTFRAAAPQQRQQVAGVQTRGAARRPASAGARAGNRVVLTRQDVASMQVFKLDPKNPEHVKQYAREKLEVK